MKKMEYGKNYAYIFFIFLGIMLFLSVARFSKFIILFTFSLFFLCLSLLELHSGIALSRSWTADCRKKDHPFQFYISVILGFIVGSFMLVMAFLP